MRRLYMIVGVVAAGMLAVAGPLPAGASPTTVGTTPASFTPWLLRSTPNQRVRELVQCGSTMYAVGTISAVKQGTTQYALHNAFSFSATSGAVTAWRPQVNGTVNSVALTPDCSTAYLGGSFSTVDGIPAANIAAVDTATGAIETTFAHSAGSDVETLQYVDGQLVAGGGFNSINGVSRSRIASLDPVTGAVTTYVNFKVSGNYPNSGTKVYNSQLSHAGTRMLVEGTFTFFGGQARQQILMLDLGSTSATVDPWTSAEFTQACAPKESFYVRAATWSPDDTTVYIATTGYKPASGPGSHNSDPRAGLCDAAAAFPATAASVVHRWVNYTGCDSLYGVASDANNVYVAGHERWANNSHGCDVAGPGFVNRPGLGSLGPTSGQATPWNPTRSRGYGADDLLLTPAGLWIASDNFSDGGAQYCGGVGNKGGICFLPY